MSDFQKLLADLESAAAEAEVMAKALPAEDGKDDKNIQAAAADGGGQDDDDDIDPNEDNEDKGGEDGEGKGGKPMVKSFGVKLEDGQEAQVIDGEELLKSLDTLNGRVAAIETGNEPLAKALTQAIGLIQTQGTILKSLNEQVAKLSSQGKGRKTMIAVNERPAPGEQTMTKSQPAQMSGGELMAKALAAQREGKLTGLQVATAEASLNHGAPIDPAVLSIINPR